MAHPQTPHDPQPYPLGLRLAGRRVLVVGGGAVATRRVPALLDAGRRRGAGRARADPGAARPRRRRPAAAGRRAGSSRPTWTAPGWCRSPSTTRSPPPRSAPPPTSAGSSAYAPTTGTAATAWTPAVTRHGPVTVAVLGGGDPRRAMAVRDAVRDLLRRRRHPSAAAGAQRCPLTRWRPQRGGWRWSAPGRATRS